MDQYKISQTPTSKGKKPRKTKVVTPKRKDARTINPQAMMLVVVIALGLVLATVFVMRTMRKPAVPTASGPVVKGAAGTQGVVPGEALTEVTTALNNKNAAGLTAHYASKVHVIVLKSAVNQTVGSKQAQGLVTDPLNSAQTPWNWHVSSGDLSAWQTGPYGQYFTGNVVVGISGDGTVISIHFDPNGQIDVVFVAPVGDLTSPASRGSTGTGTGSTGGTSSPTTTTPATELPKTD